MKLAAQVKEAKVTQFVLYVKPAVFFPAVKVFDEIRMFGETHVFHSLLYLSEPVRSTFERFSVSFDCVVLAIL